MIVLDYSAYVRQRITELRLNRKIMDEMRKLDDEDLLLLLTVSRHLRRNRGKQQNQSLLFYGSGITPALPKSSSTVPLDICRRNLAISGTSEKLHRQKQAVSIMSGIIPIDFETLSSARPTHIAVWQDGPVFDAIK